MIGAGISINMTQANQQTEQTKQPEPEYKFYCKSMSCKMLDQSVCIRRQEALFRQYKSHGNPFAARITTLECLQCENITDKLSSFLQVGTQKRCSKCRKFKSIEDFNVNRQTRSGLQAYCKMCLRIIQQESRERKKLQKREIKQQVKENKQWVELEELIKREVRYK